MNPTVSSFPSHHPLVAIVGPTAVGKSALALALAQAFGGEIVNADSRQVYRSMDIGTAKPTPDERALVPHHLLDLVDPDQEFSLAAFLAHATQAIGEVHQRGRLPMLVGGTGQYVWALLEGWQAPQVAPDRELRQGLEARAQREGVGALYAELQGVDPEGATLIHPHNLRRIIRALEVYHQTGVPFSQQRRRGLSPYRTLVLGLSLPRQELYQRIDQRVDQMIAAGWVGEVQRLLEVGYSPELPALSSLGYRELTAHLRGNLSLEEAVGRIKTATHRFVRHQDGWFRRGDSRIRWLQAGPDAYQQAHALVSAFLLDAASACATMGVPEGAKPAAPPA